MNLTVSLIVMLVAYTSGAIMEAIFGNKITSRFIPIQNVCVGIISGLICYFGGLEKNLLVSIGSCMMATLSAGGITHLINSVKEKN